jgi:hypothetical protein
MKVIFIGKSKKLITNHIYDVDYYNPNNYNISLVGLGRYYKKNFLLANGDVLPNQPFDSRKESTDKDRDLKKGDLVFCKSDHFKYLLNGSIYRVSSVEKINNYRNIITLEGYSRKLNFNYNFRKLNTKEVRSISLNQIFDKKENFSVEFVSKFKQVKNKNKILIDFLSKSILDEKRHHLDIIDWGCKLSGNYKIQREDYKDLLDKKLSEIIEIIENEEK